MIATITCPECGTTSYYEVDVKLGYCFRCRRQTSPAMIPEDLRGGDVRCPNRSTT